MRRFRYSSAVAVLVLAVPVAVEASPVQVCQLVVDERGDARDPKLGAMADDADFDLLSGDIATNGTTVTALLRLARLPETPSPLVGTTYRFTFSVDGGRYVYLSADVAGLATGFSAWEHDQASPVGGTHRVGVATGVVDTARREVRISTSVTTFSQPILASSRLTALRMDSSRWYGYGGDPIVGRTGTGSRIDEAESPATYRAGTPSCVAVGK